MLTRSLRVLSLTICLALAFIMCAFTAISVQAADSGTPVSAQDSALDTWYLAEGTNGWGFSTFIGILNPNTTEVTIRLTVMPKGSTPFTEEFKLEAERTGIIMINDTVVPDDYSTKVECLEGKPIAVDRQMIWEADSGLGLLGIHSSVGVRAPSTDWYLPEGSSDWGFESWLLIQNPNAQAASCDLTYMIEGVGPITVNHVVPARSRESFSMASDIGSRDASVRVQSNVPVIPERAMYKNNRREGHESIGTTSSSRNYYLAEGTTDWGFTTYVLIQNPNDAPADVTLTYMTTGGPLQQPTFQMAPNSRTTVRVNDALPASDFSTKVSASIPVIAERAMYWNNGTGEACHDSIGLTAPHDTFYFPNGTVDAEYGIETWTLVQNPNDTPVSIRLTYYPNVEYPSGDKVEQTATIPANSRETYAMPDVFEGYEAGTSVECLTGNRRIMAEQAIYTQGRSEGCNTIGAYSD